MKPFQVPTDRDASGRSLGREELDLLAEVIRSGSLNSNSGPMVRSFEREFAEHQGSAHCVACNSGSFAVQAALAALDLPRGSSVVTTPVTDFGALTALLYEGLQPRFCDVDPQTLQPTPASIARALDEPAPGSLGDGPVSAVILTSLFGRPSEAEAVAQLCQQRGLPLVEDAAQSLETLRGGQRIGSFGQISTFSFQQGKHITCGEGGAVLCEDEALARRVRLFVNKAWPYGEPDPDHLFVAPNGRMTELSGAVLRAQLARLPGLVERRIATAARLLEEIEGIPGLSHAPLGPGDRHSFWRIALDVDPDRIDGGADGLAKALRDLGIPCAPHYVGKPAFALRAFRDLGASERACDYPGVQLGLERVLVLPWNEGIGMELARKMGQALRRTAEGLAR